MATIADTWTGDSGDVRWLRDGQRIRAEIDAVGRKRCMRIDFSFFFEQGGRMDKDLVNPGDQARFPFGERNVDDREGIFVVNVVAALVKWDAIKRHGELGSPEVENCLLAARATKKFSGLCQPPPETPIREPTRPVKSGEPKRRLINTKAFSGLMGGYSQFAPSE